MVDCVCMSWFVSTAPFTKWLTFSLINSTFCISKIFIIFFCPGKTVFTVGTHMICNVISARTFHTISGLQYNTCFIPSIKTIQYNPNSALFEQILIITIYRLTHIMIKVILHCNDCLYCLLVIN